MNPADALPLRDIHLPETVSWWPPAIGWWILLLLSLLILYVLFVWVTKWLQPKLNKSAKVEVDKVLAAWQQHQNAHRLVQQMSQTIRRIGISYLTREEYAGLVGEAWYQQVNQLVQNNPFSDQVIKLLIHAPYQKKPELDDAQVAQLIAETQSWVQALPLRSAADLYARRQHV